MIQYINSWRHVSFQALMMQEITKYLEIWYIKCSWLQKWRIYSPNFLFWSHNRMIFWLKRWTSFKTQRHVWNKWLQVSNPIVPTLSKPLKFWLCLLKSILFSILSNLWRKVNFVDLHSKKKNLWVQALVKFQRQLKGDLLQVEQCYLILFRFQQALTIISLNTHRLYSLH